MTMTVENEVIWNSDDMHAAIFNAVCGLAERLTGEKMTVTVVTATGRTLRLSGDGVTWLRETPEAA